MSDLRELKQPFRYDDSPTPAELADYHGHPEEEGEVRSFDCCPDSDMAATLLLEQAARNSRGLGRKITRLFLSRHAGHAILETFYR